MLKVKGRTPLDKTRIHRILIRFTNWIGDAVMALPALEAVKENFPDSTITVVGKPWVIPLLENHPSVDHILPLEKRGKYPADLFEVLRVAARIRRGGFDLAILFQNAFEAALLSRLGGIGLRIGYNTDGRRFLLSHAILRDKSILGQHQVNYYLAILRALGWQAETRDPRLYISDNDRESTCSLLSQKDIGEDDFLVGVSPGAAFGPAKRWPAERFAEIGDRAVEAWHAKVLILGSKGDRPIGECIDANMKHETLNLCGSTALGEVMALIDRCRVFVTNDSGLMHIAAALNVPTVAIFGSTDPVATGPRSENAVVVKSEVDCAPCLKPVCPGDFRCMLDIGADRVWDEMLHLTMQR